MAEEQEQDSSNLVIRCLLEGLPLNVARLPLLLLAHARRLPCGVGEWCARCCEGAADVVAGPNALHIKHVRPPKRSKGVR